MLLKLDNTWDVIGDVVIIGYGMAGAVAALTAQESGADVIILDKQPTETIYTNSSLSGGVFLRSNDVAKTVSYMEALNHKGNDIGWTESQIIQVWAEYVADNTDWIERLGGSIRLLRVGGEYPEIPGTESLEVWVYKGSGVRLMQFLYDHVSRRGIHVKHGTKARRLLTNLNGEVVGVRAETAEGRQIGIGAARAVILACGGFEFNERLKLNYMKAYPAYFSGSPANTGDGIAMALAVGADLWHMNCCSAGWAIKFADLPWGFIPDFGGKGWIRRLTNNVDTPEPAGYIVVDRNGVRYTSEDARIHSLFYELGIFETNRLETPRIPSYWIFDHKRIEAGPLPITHAGAAGPQQLYRWSNDNMSELEKGWIISGRTIKALARSLELPPDTLDKTVAAYNRGCHAGHDAAFKRRPQGLIPLETPPFYALKLWPGGPNTQGGPRRNALSQILNPDGEPIPRLYGAGELGSIFGMLYPSGGGNLAECIASGRIAGENAAKERPHNLRPVASR